MVPAAEAIQGAVGGMLISNNFIDRFNKFYVKGMVEAAEQAVTIVDEEYKGQISKTTDDLKNACQQLVNQAYLSSHLSITRYYTF